MEVWYDWSPHPFLSREEETSRVPPKFDSNPPGAETTCPTVPVMGLMRLAPVVSSRAYIVCEKEGGRQAEIAVRG